MMNQADNYLKYLILAMLAAGTSAFTPQVRASQTIALTTTPVSDGAIWDSHKPWVNAPSKISDADMTAQAGSFYGNLSVTILEFPLPPKVALKSSKLVSARLIVSINPVENATELTLAPIDVDIYGYDGESADGVVTTEDWSAGKKLQRWLSKGKTVIGYGAPMPQIDVTQMVRKSINEGKEFVGFRFRGEEVEQGVNNSDIIIFRTAEFAEKYGASNVPTLVLEFE